MKTRASITAALATLALTLVGCAGGEGTDTADLVLTNGTVYTIEEAAPMAEAVAIRGDRIVFVGDATEAEGFIGSDTEVIDLAGRTVLPGFVSAHDHIVASRWMSQGADLNAATSPDEIQAILRAYVEANPDAPRIRGMGWSTANAGGMPTSALIDEVIPDKPAILIDYTGHEALLNTRAMELAGIDRDSPDLAPGTTYWVRDEEGNPTGVGIEGQWMPSFVELGFWEPDTMVRESAEELFEIATRNGTTTVLVPGFVTPNVVDAQGSMDDYETVMALLAEMDASGQLPLRLLPLVWFKSPQLEPDQVAEFAARMRETYSGDKLRVGGIKVHPETNWNAWGAPMVEPYSNRDTRGNFGVTPERQRAMVLEANQRGLDVFTHADGSATIRAAIDAIEAAKEAGHTDARNAIHHLTWLTPWDYERIVELDIPVNITPAFSNDWAGQDVQMLEYLGQQRIDTELSRYVDLMRDGVNVSIAADVPSTSPSMQGPLYVIESAVTFRDPQSPDSRPFPPHREPMTVDEAIRAMTINPAWQLSMDDKIGSLTEGKYADLVILQQDPHDVAPRDIADIAVVGTILGGAFTHRDGM